VLSVQRQRGVQPALRDAPWLRPPVYPGWRDCGQWPPTWSKRIWRVRRLV